MPTDNGAADNSNSAAIAAMQGDGSPPPPIATEEMPDATAAAIAAMQGDGLSPPPIATKEMPAVTAAGFDLAKITMAMISGAVVLLFAVFTLSNCSGQAEMDKANQHFISISGRPPSADTDVRAIKLAGIFRAAAADPAYTAPAGMEAEITALIAEAKGRSDITALQRANITDKCFPLPAQDAATRKSDLETCADTMVAIFTPKDSASQHLGIIRDWQKSISEDRSAFWAFWLQMAQLLLINLLLPILTALLGYIFGTQQSKSDD